MGDENQFRNWFQQSIKADCMHWSQTCKMVNVGESQTSKTCSLITTSTISLVLPYIYSHNWFWIQHRTLEHRQYIGIILYDYQTIPLLLSTMFPRRAIRRLEYICHEKKRTKHWLAISLGSEQTNKNWSGNIINFLSFRETQKRSHNVYNKWISWQKMHIDNERHTIITAANANSEISTFTKCHQK